MATNKKITELTEVELGGIADDDVLVIVDISENETKKVRRSTLRTDLAGVATLAATSPLAVDASIGDVTVSISGQVPVNNGGTGASTAAAARTNLGLGTISTQDYTAVNIDGGAIDGTPIGATTQSTGGFSSLTIASSTAVTSVDTDLTSVSASDDTLASAKAIKTYVDSQVGTVDTLSEILANGNTTGANNIIVTAGQSITVDTISETTAAGGVTVDSLLIKDGGITAAGTSTFAGQTISNLGTVTTADINGGTIDGTTIGGTTAAAGSFTTGTFSSTLSAGATTISNDGSTALTVNQGVGTVPAATSALLLVNNNDASDNCRITMIGGTSGDSMIEFGNSGDRDEGYIRYQPSTNAMTFAANTNVIMTMDGDDNSSTFSGNVETKYSTAGGSTGSGMFVTNSNDAINDLSNIIFGVSSGANTAYRKGGIFFQAKDANRNGDMVFALANAANSTNVTASNAVLTLSQSGNATFAGDVAIGGSASDLGTQITGGLVISDHGTTPGIKIANSTTGVGNNAGTDIQINTAGTFQLVQRENLGVEVYTNNTLALTVDSSQNVGIGTTSIEDYGSGFKTLEIAGSTNTEGGVLKIVTSGSAGSGTSGTEMIMYTNSTSAYINVVSNHPLRFYTNNTERMRIDSSGNVGIGETSPSYKLEVNGTGSFVTGTDTNGFSVLENSSGDQGIFMGVTGGAGSGNAYIKAGSLTTDSVGLIFQTASSGSEGTALTLDSSKNATFTGDVQIANANEFKIPDSGGNVGSVNGAAIFAENPSANEDLRIEQRNSGNGRIILGIAGDDDLVVDTSGNVGIGTTNPSTPLEINVNTAVNQLLLTYSTTDHMGLLAGTTGGGIIVEDNNFFAVWHQDYSNKGTETGLTERFRINSAGFVGIAQTNPGAKLNVVDNSATAIMAGDATDNGAYSAIGAASGTAYLTGGSATSETVNLVLRTANAGNENTVLTLGGSDLSATFEGYVSTDVDKAVVTDNNYDENAGSSYNITVPSSHGIFEVSIYAARNDSGSYGTRHQVYHVSGIGGYPYTAWAPNYNLVSNIERTQVGNGPTISISPAVNGVLAVTISGTGNLYSAYAVRQLVKGPGY